MYINLKLQDVGFVNSDDAIQVNKSKDEGHSWYKNVIRC
jgi:hypothetical protein